MLPHKLNFLTSICFILPIAAPIEAQRHKAPPGGTLAIVVDERLSALRSAPDLRAPLIQRLGRGRLVSLRGVKAGHDGIVFFLVNSSSRTHGWIQREAVAIPSRLGSDVNLLSLIKLSSDFDRIVRARIFLDYFARSSLRPEVLLILGDAAERLSEKISRDARRRIGDTSSAPEFSFFLNYPGLDRYNRQRIRFVFDEKARRLHYDGSAWLEILRRYPRSAEADQARSRLAQASIGR
jgi:hypothetical protein